MHHIKVIKDGNVNNVVKEQLVDGVQYVDDEPREGSLNGITSGAVAKVAGDVGDVKDVIPEGTTEENKLVNEAGLGEVAERVTTAEGDIDSIEGKIPSGASSSNKLVTESDLEAAQDSWQSGFTPKGEATVSQIDALTTQSNGDQYIVTDSGTITAGTLEVTAGDTVAWDSTNEVWYKVNQYAKQSDVSALQTKTTNISASIAPEFDSTRTSENTYKVGETVMYTDGKAYTFKVDHYGEWNASDVVTTNEETRSKLSKERGATDSIRLSKLENFIYDEMGLRQGLRQYENIVFEQGGFQNGILFASSQRIRSTLLIPVSKGNHIDFSMEATGYRVVLSVLDENLKFLSSSQSAFNINNESAAYLFIVMFKEGGGTLPITPSEGSSAGLTISIGCLTDSSIRSSIETLKNEMPNLHTFQPINFILEQGRYTYGAKASSDTFVRLSSPISVVGGEKLSYSIASGWTMFVHYLDSDSRYIIGSSGKTGTGEVTCPTDSKYACVFIYNGGNDITPSDAETYADFSLSPFQKSFDKILGSTLFNAPQIFDKCICIGDSLTAGFSTYGGVTIGSQTAVNLPFNWPSYMARRTGCSYKNMGIGSSTTHHWRYSDGPTETYRPDITLANEFANAYFIGLGANDKRGSGTIGSSSDIKTNKDENSDTFYGNYDWIVRTLHGYNPNAIIFVMTMATLEGDRAEAYNTAIRRIADLYDYVILIDLWKDSRYKSYEMVQLYNGGHLNPLGYNLAASIIYDNLCRTLIENESKFMLLPLFRGYPVPN